MLTFAKLRVIYFCSESFQKRLSNVSCVTSMLTLSVHNVGSKQAYLFNCIYSLIFSCSANGEAFIFQSTSFSCKPAVENNTVRLYRVA